MGPLDQDERISAYLDGELPAAERARFEEELSRSGDLRQLVEELRAVRESMQALPQHRLEHDFAERVLRRAERLMLTGQPIRAAADPQPVATARVVPAPQREPVSSHMSRRHFQSWRPWAWSALALCVATVIVGIERWQSKDRQVAVVVPTDKERVAHAGKALPTGELIADDGAALRQAATGPEGVVASRVAEDQTQAEKQANGLALPAAPIDADAPNKEAAAQTTIAPRTEGMLAKKPGPSLTAGSSGSAATGPADKAPAEQKKDAAAPAPATSLATNGAARSKAAPAPEIADGQAGGFAPKASDLADSRGEVQRRAVKSATLDARDFEHELVVVECASAPDVPREAFPRLLARHGFAFYEAAPTGATYSVPGVDANNADKVKLREPAAADAPAAPPAAPLPTASAPGGSSRVNQAPPAQAKLSRPLAQPEATPKFAAPADAIAVDAEKRKELDATIDRLDAAAATPSDVVMFYVEGTPGQVLGLVSDLRAQPVEYRALALSSAATAPNQQQSIERWAEKRANGRELAAETDDRAAIALRARDLATTHQANRNARADGAWAVELYERLPVETEHLNASADEKPREAAKTTDQAKQLELQRNVAPPPQAASGQPGDRSNLTLQADPAAREADAGSANGARTTGSAGGQLGAAGGKAGPGSSAQHTPAKTNASLGAGAPGSATPGAGAGVDGGRRSGSDHSVDEQSVVDHGGVADTKGRGSAEAGGGHAKALAESRRDQTGSSLNQPATPPAVGKPGSAVGGAGKFTEASPAASAPVAKDDKAESLAEQPSSTARYQFGNSLKEAGDAAQGSPASGPPGGDAAAKGSPAPQRMHAVIMFRLAPASGK